MRLIEKSQNNNQKHRQSAIWVQEPLHLVDGFESKFRFRIHEPGVRNGIFIQLGM